MSTDYAEKERDFVASLGEDTGRDLGGWMTAITESGLNERNANIDWLRHQGFQFAWASWLERIHHNGGRLIYAEDDAAEPPQPSSRPAAATPAKTVDEPASPSPAVATRPLAARSPAARPPAQAPSRSSAGNDIQHLLANAKGLRPLAEHILREVAILIPDVEHTASNAFITMSAPSPFAALLPSPRKLRLFADFGPAGQGRAKTAETVNRLAPPFPRMLLLDDARSIDDEFRRMIRAAAGR
jgi:hypothetical protein